LVIGRKMAIKFDDHRFACAEKISDHPSRNPFSNKPRAACVSECVRRDAAINASKLASPRERRPQGNRVKKCVTSR
jgi:hypothetical protein